MKKNKLPMYTYDDLEWAFNEGIHEGMIREYYKNNIGNFYKKNLKHYIKTCNIAPYKIKLLKIFYNFFH